MLLLVRILSNIFSCRWMWSLDLLVVCCSWDSVYETQSMPKPSGDILTHIKSVFNAAACLVDFIETICCAKILIARSISQSGLECRGAARAGTPVHKRFHCRVTLSWYLVRSHKCHVRPTQQLGDTTWRETYVGEHPCVAMPHPGSDKGRRCLYFLKVCFFLFFFFW